MENEYKKFQLWRHVLSVSDSITKDAQCGDMKKEDLLNYLTSIEETFKRTSDPADDFQGYVLLQLCRSVSLSLDYFKH